MQRVASLYADVYTAAGSAVGTVTDIWNWSCHEVLDAAGEWTLECWANTNNASMLVEGRRLDVYATFEDGEKLLSTGTLTGMHPKIVRDGTSFGVEGKDRLYELTDRIIPGLNVCEQQWVDLSDSDYGLLGWVRVASSGAADPNIAITEAHDGNDGTYETIYLMSAKDGYPLHAAYLYVGYDSRFDRIRILFAGSDYADNAQTLIAQYYNGEGWQTLTVSDGTANPGTFMQNGDITFTRPSDWVRYNAAEGGGNWFWVRLKLKRTAPDDPSWTDYFRLAEVDVYADVPTTNGLNLIMAYAPDGWKQSGYDATAEEAYDVIAGQTVLAALERLREQVGGHYRFGISGGTAYVDWLTSFAASGLSAGSALPDANNVRLLELRARTDMADYCSRVYPICSGAQLANATRTVDSPYELSISGGYLRNATAETDIGRRERAIDFDVTSQQSDSLTQHPELAANALVDQMLVWLKQHDSIGDFYQAECVGFREVQQVGETIDVTASATVEDVETIDIDETLNITDVNSRIDDGLLRARMELSTLERKVSNDTATIADDIAKRKRSTGSGSYVSTITGTTTSQPPTAGADIRVSGYQVSRAGAGVLLFSGSGALLAEYSTLAAALAAAAAGDVVDLPAGTLTGDVTVPAGVTVRGMGEATVIDGAVVLGAGARLIDVIAALIDSDTDDLVVVQGGNGSVCVHVTAIGEQSGAGNIVGIVSTADSADTPMRCYDCPIFVGNSGSGSAWWTGEVVAGGLQMHQGSVRAELGA